MIRVCALLAMAACLQAHIVTVHTESEELLFEMRKGETLSQVVARAEPFVQHAQHVMIEVAAESSQPSCEVALVQVPVGHPRDYAREVTSREKETIRYIITTLANHSIIALNFVRGDLEQAGASIHHIHPLKFLMTIFSDEELKVSIRHVRGKSLVWSQFLGGIKQRFTDEIAAGNLTQEQIDDFCKKLSISPDMVCPSIQSRHWEGLIDALITHVPRKGEYRRYDCNGRR